MVQEKKLYIFTKSSQKSSQKNIVDKNLCGEKKG